MKKIFLIILASILSCTVVNAQKSMTAQQVLEKCQKALNIKSGLQASFTISSPSIKSSTGRISVKGQKFQAVTSEATMWYNGKTMWTYVKQNNEVNVTVPTETERQRINPYSFINLYKQGYKLKMTTEGKCYKVHMSKQGAGIDEMVVLIDQKTYMLTSIKMKQKKGWTVITMNNVTKQSLKDSTFTFNSKDYPKAEIIDLR